MNEPDPNAATIPATVTPSADEKQWAMFAHLSSLLGGLLTSGWGGSAGFFIGPLIIWLMKKDTMPFVDDQGKEALNFSITVSIVCVALVIMTIMTLGVGALLTIPLLMAVGIASLVFVIIAAIKSHEGVRYRYPVALRLVK
jgi:hypothetical protein